MEEQRAECHISSPQKPCKQEESEVFKQLREKKINQPVILHPVKLSLEGEIRNFSEKQTLSEFVVSTHSLKGML